MTSCQSAYCLSPRLRVFPLYAVLTASLISLFPEIQTFRPFYAIYSCNISFGIQKLSEMIAKRATFETRTVCKTGAHKILAMPEEA